MERTRVTMQLKSFNELADADRLCRGEERRVKEREIKEALEIAEIERTRRIRIEVRIKIEG